MTFQLVGGHPALDLVNTLDWRFGAKGPKELIETYNDLLRFTEQSKLLTPERTRQLRRSADAGSAAHALAKATALREAMAEIFYARLDGRNPSLAACETLERNFKVARLRQQLNWKRSPRVDWEWTTEKDSELPVWALALSASDLMTSDAVDRVRACDNPECRWLFLDTSKNHTRRWCDMKVCGNRMKARRFKAHKRN